LISEKEILMRAKCIKLVLMDVDGVLTDNSIIYYETNKDIKAFSARDGLGIEMLHHIGIKTGIISGRKSPIIEYRARELGIEEINQGVKDKKACLQKLLKKYSFSKQEVLYIGDDLIDLPVLLEVGLSAAAADAHEEVLQRVHVICQSPGGRGAVREIADLIIKAQGKWEEVLLYYCPDIK
jgi:3-deoxy-D-manno-octulosonate 8-phosphate phosphatase (KDO 8-P phosphatase)